MPSGASAQPLQSFQDLALRVNLGDWLRIESESGERIGGRVTGLTRDELTLDTDAGERRFATGTVLEVMLRRPTRRAGVLIGAGIGSVAGALAACVPADRSECADAPIVLGALGAGMGLALSALLPKTTTVYRSFTGIAPSPQSGRPGPLDALGLRANLGDWVRVEDRSGARITGRLTHLTGEEMTLDTDAGPRQLAATAVRAVAIRGYRLGQGALIGTGVFAILAVATKCRSNPDCVPVAVAALGAGVGLAVGAVVPRMTTVYRVQETNVSLSPEIIRGGIGFRGNLRW
jgi:hypothetical protein